MLLRMPLSCSRPHGLEVWAEEVPIRGHEVQRVVFSFLHFKKTPLPARVFIKKDRSFQTAHPLDGVIYELWIFKKMGRDVRY